MQFLYTVIRRHLFPVKLAVVKAPPAMSVATKVFVAYVLMVLDVRSGCVRGVGCRLVLCYRMDFRWPGLVASAHGGFWRISFGAMPFISTHPFVVAVRKA